MVIDFRGNTRAVLWRCRLYSVCFLV